MLTPSSSSSSPLNVQSQGWHSKDPFLMPWTIRKDGINGTDVTGPGKRCIILAGLFAFIACSGALYRRTTSFHDTIPLQRPMAMHREHSPLGPSDRRVGNRAHANPPQTSSIKSTNGDGAHMENPQTLFVVEPREVSLAAVASVIGLAVCYWAIRMWKRLPPADETVALYTISGERAKVTEETLSAAERFIKDIENEATPDDDEAGANALLKEQRRRELSQLQEELDGLYVKTFKGREVTVQRAGSVEVTYRCDEMSEAVFASLGRTDPDIVQALITQAQAEGGGWVAFQTRSQTIALKRNRLLQQLQDTSSWKRSPATTKAQREQFTKGTARIVLICGFESFNARLYRDVAAKLKVDCPGLELLVYSDRDVQTRREEIAAALKEANVFFGSLLFDYD
eukprot:EG_transcript_15491